MAIEIEKLTCVYDAGAPFAATALSEVSLTVGDGEFAAVIGHTGSGKSTLVQHFNGLLKPTGAEKLVVEGVDLCAPKPDLKLLRSRVGMVFQYPEYQLFENTVFDDIAFGPRNMKLSEDEVEERVRESMELVGLDTEAGEASPFELSGGQKRRAAIAGVLSMRPHLLVLDEPVAGLDPKGKAEILGVVQKYREKTGSTVVMISHNMDDIAELADHVIVMSHGKKEMDGTPEEVFSQPDKVLALGLDLPTVCRVTRVLRARGIDAPEKICREKELEAWFRGVEA